MKCILLIALVMAIAAPAAAASADGPCLPDLVLPLGWSSNYYEGGLGERDITVVTLGVRNLADRDIVMVEGQVEFQDALGGAVEPFPAALPRDVLLVAGASGNTFNVEHRGPSRLTGIDPNLVSLDICITGVVFADGTIQRAGS